MLTTALLPQSAPLEPMHAQYVPVLTDIAPLLLIRELPQDEYPTPALPRPFTSHDVEPVMFGPNITGSIKPFGVACADFTASGALSGGKSSTPWNGKTAVSSKTITDITFSASLSNSMYGAASDVHPASTRLIHCIKI